MTVWKKGLGGTFQEAEQRDIQYRKKASPEEKLDTLQVLREIYYVMKNENPKRLFKEFIASLNNHEYRLDFFHAASK